MVTSDGLQPVDDAARRLARGLVRGARYGALAVLDPATGGPLASRVAVAPDMDGSPVILISALSGHFGALLADPRASLLLGEPGRGDPLAHPRLSLQGRALRIEDPGERARLRSRYLGRHPKAQLYVDFADFAFWRIAPDGAALNGGFGRAHALSPADILTPMQGCAGLADMEAEAVAHMNADHADALALYATRLAGAPGDAGPWRLASLDPEGIDLMAGDRLARVWFDPPLVVAADLRPRLSALADAARAADRPRPS